MDDKEKKKILDALSGKGDKCPKCGSRNLNCVYHGEPFSLGLGDDKMKQFKRCGCHDCGEEVYFIEET